MLVDGIENTTDIAFGAKPERLYILQGNKVVYRGGPGPFLYDVEELREVLENRVLAAGGAAN